MEAFFKILILAINLCCVVYLLYVIRGLFKYGKKVFEYRNKTASIVILILTIVQLGNKENELGNRFEIVKTKINQPIFDTNFYELEDIAFDHVRLFIKAEAIDEMSVLFTGSLSHSGLVMGTQIKLIDSNIYNEGDDFSIRIRYKKNWIIYGIQLYSQVKIENIILK
jgi:hypothetical protein